MEPFLSFPLQYFDKRRTCPKCGSNEFLSELNLRGGSGHPSYIDIMEPEPANRPFVWSPKSVQSQFTVYVCTGCGYSEQYAINYQALNEGLKKGYQGG